MSMRYFVIVYDRRSGRVSAPVREFGPDHVADAIRERFRLEREGGADTEVVVLGASSLEGLKQTHSRYFQSVGELIGEASTSI